MLISSVILISCGTINGTLNGAGSVLEGIASDARQLGSIFWILKGNNQNCVYFTLRPCWKHLAQNT